MSARVDGVADFIREHVGLFESFTPEGIAELVSGSLVRSFETNEAIAHQGSEATHLGVVLSGTVAASAVTGGTRQTLGRLQPGDTFAEAALITGNPLLADFIAESHCEVLLIPVSLFQSIIVAEPGAVGTDFTNNRGSDENACSRSRKNESRASAG